MLKTFRDSLKHLKWVLWIVIVAFILVYIPDLVSNNLSETAATVGDMEVSRTEFQRTYQQMERRMREQLGEQWTPEMARQLGLRQQALQQAVQQKILLQEARDMGLTVTDEELREEVLVQFGGQFPGTERYRQILSSQGMTVAQFEQGLRHALLHEKLIDVLASNLYVSDEEVEEAYRRSVERAAIRFIRLNAGQFAEDVEVTDSEITTYFEEHREQFRLPERREVAYLMVDSNEMRMRAQIDEGELMEYYETHEDQFTRPEQVRVRQIFVTTESRSEDQARQILEQARQRIEGGESFAEVAGDVSEDPSSADRGGELGFIGRGLMPPAFDEAAFNAIPGELVGPVEADFGLHLLEVTERREGGLQPFAEVRGQIQSRLLADELPQRVENRARELARQIEEGNLTTAEELQTLAESDPAVVFAAPAPFSQGETLPGLGRPRDFLDTVFAMEEPGAVSDPVAVPRGQAIVLLEEVLAPRDQELDEVRDQVRDQIADTKAQQLAIDRLAEIKTQVEAGTPLEEAAGSLGAQVQESQEFGPGGTIQGVGYNPKVADAALGMEEGEIGGPFEAGQGALLFEVTQRTTGDPAELEEQADTIRDNLEQQKLTRFLSSLLRQRQIEMDVRYSTWALDEGDDEGGATQPRPRSPLGI